MSVLCNKVPVFLTIQTTIQYFLAALHRDECQLQDRKDSKAMLFVIILKLLTGGKISYKNLVKYSGWFTSKKHVSLQFPLMW